ncbi:MAG: ribulose-phosphate 3-epimerase [Clostridia bacterium]|nr:ribulose-phosphate 3-epimerase [Bacillota bacterium]MCR4669078.1 ribulose-phosphate 3-epimerase [Clostridia bacterium]
MKMIAPSILSADFSRLGEQVLEVSRAGSDFLHIDVMDGAFVPNITFGATVMKSLDKLDTAPYDVHLMIEDPDRFIMDFVTEKTEYVTVHQEACVHLNRTLSHIKSFGVKSGVALNPATSLTTLENVLDDVDMVLIMSVNPGFGGQSFIENSIAKIAKLKEMREAAGKDFLIEVDGGVTLDNAVRIAQAGADILVAGSAVFGADSPGERVMTFSKLLGRA